MIRRRPKQVFVRAAMRQCERALSGFDEVTIQSRSLRRPRWMELEGLPSSPKSKPANSLRVGLILWLPDVNGEPGG